ncbi:peptide ABC transporter substrate-binding protein [Brevibacillus sp. WF146]|uniref:peptide ABC transporter substrate-binding protein n=1 Tax=Brevibacillus sp. WF146 TaxID=319501 RepID=UPI0007EDDD9A|nr:peptide ABC transporter substrate-binding protein [Brevibacillus sp. WF146]UYZ13286.1 peptide ABC transporter substrate-binding protein [Brevibacillus sp. WF146]
MRKTMSISLGTLLAVSAVLASVGSAAASGAAQPTAEAKKSGKVLRVNLGYEIPTADPSLSEDPVSAAIVRATFDGLTRTGPDGKPQPSIAEKIDVSADLLTYTFHLRDAKWSNGDPVTAHDFEYAWKRALDPKTGANYAYQLYYLKNGKKANRGEAKLDEVGVKALDAKTLQVTLEQPTPFFLELTSFPTYYPVNKKVAEANPKWANEAGTHVGNGPFKLAAWEHKQKLTLVKNDKYWDKDAVKLDRIEGTMVEDENTELAMFDNGELDWAGQPLGQLPPDALPYLKEEGLLQTQPIAGVYYYKFNTEQPPFTNAKIRKAFAYALNRKALSDEGVIGTHLPALGFVPPTMTVSSHPYFKDNDAETAKKLLAEGMKELGISKLPPITLSYNTSEAHKKIAEAIQKQWRQTLGAEVKLENKEWKVFLEDLHNGSYQIARYGWLGDFNDPINYLELFMEKDGGNNDTHWENAEYRKLLTQSATQTDPEKRRELLVQAEAILMDEMPVLPIYYYTQSYVKRDHVQGVLIDGLGFIDWKWASIK